MSASKRPPFVPIAVVGAGCLMPGATSVAGFWQNILARRDLVTDVPRTHWLIEDYYDPDPKATDKTYCRRGAFLPDVPFDAMGFGIPPSILSATDSSQLLALIVAQTVLDDVRSSALGVLDRSRVSVILGVTGAQELVGSLANRMQRPIWERSLRQMGLPESQVQEACGRISEHYVGWQESSFPGLLGNVVAGRIANRLGFGGTNCVVDAACASALSAVQVAVHELALGESDMVVTGGVDTLNDIFMFMCFSKTPALSMSGDCRPFSEDADGTLLGEGLGMVALKRLEDAERDGDHVYAVIRGMGSSSDGRSKSVYAPVPAGQARALRRCYEVAGYGPETVELVEAHGTATRAGDAAELEGLRLVFDDGRRADRQWCALGSVKSQIGHTKAAAGIAGLLKVVLALHHRVLPPTIKVGRPTSAGDFANSPFYVATEPRPWIRGSAHPRRGSVSSFGFGGSNFHVTCEEYLGSVRPGRADAWPDELAVFCANDAAGLLEALAAARGADPTALARQTQLAYDHRAPRRIALLLSGSLDERLGRAMEVVRSGAASRRGGIWYQPGVEAGKIAFLFPGQGSQYPRMGEALAMTFDQARSVWDAAEDLVRGELSLSRVVFPRPCADEAERGAVERRLVETQWAQPALGVASAATLRLLEALGLRPDATGGHSFGELTALYASGALTLEGLVSAARRRGELMAAASEIQGAMAAISARPEVVAGLLGPDVVIANHNAPEQTVIAGPTGAVDAALERAAAAGLRASRLDVATAFHSPLVAGAAEAFSAWLADLPVASPSVPVYSNSSGARYAAGVDLAVALGAHLASPVRFVDEIEAMYADGVRTFIEVGPGSVLTGLVSRCLEGRPHAAIATDLKSQDGLSSLLGALGYAAALGLPLDLEPLWSSRAVPVPPSPPKLAIPINGSNYGKVYPQPDTRPVAPNPEHIVMSKVVPSLSADVAPAAAPPVVVTAPAAFVAPLVAAPAPVVAASPALVLSQANPWLEAFAEGQRQAAVAQEGFQRAISEAHLAFLRAHEETSRGLLGVLSGVPLAPSASPPLSTTPAALAAPIPAPAAVTHMAPPPAFVAPPPAFVAPPPAFVAPPPAPVAPPVAVAAPAPAAPPPAPVVVASARPPSGLDPARLLLEVVAEKTGYPPEMLTLEMGLESDLGIDSIKRVEILSAVRERAPGLPEVGAEQMGSLHTLGQIVDALGASLGSAPRPQPATPVAAAAPAPAAPPPAPAVVASARPPSGLDPARLLLEVVAEKTGYPPEMLTLEMGLESDLGIDSIKRVEILSAVRERAPGLPEVGAEQMGSLRTLGQIVDALGASLGSAPRPQPATPKKEDLTGRHEVALSPLEAGPSRRPGPLLLVGGGAVAEALAVSLGARGLDARVHPAGAPLEDARGEGPRGVVFLGALDPIGDLPAALATCREGFRAARAARLGEGGAFVTVTALGGDFGMAGVAREVAVLGGLAGLTKTVALEHPKALVLALDLAPGRPADLAEQIAGELVQAGPVERCVGPQGRRTLSCRRAAERASVADLGLSRRDVLVVSGGARGVTAACLLELARVAQPRLVLIGRSRIDSPEPAAVALAQDEAGLKRALLAQEPGLPLREAGRRAASILAAREARATVRALEDAGSQVRYLALDVSDAAGLRAALDPIRAEWGAITGLVHGAGVIDDRLLRDKTVEQFDQVVGTKVLGAQALLAATDGDPLRVLCLFSSVAARTGNPGQCDYALANEALNRLAAGERARRPGCHVKSIGWGPWEGGMVSPELRRQLEARGVPLLSLARGARLFVEELGGFQPSAVEVVIGGAPGPLHAPTSADEGAPRPAAVDRPGPSAAPRLRRTLTRVIQARSFPFLRDHAIGGTPVFPLVLALDWMMQAAGELVPGGRAVAAHDLRVMKGIVLREFDRGGDPLELSVQESEPGMLDMEIRSPGGGLHYKARIEVTDRPLRAPAAPAPAALTRYPHGLDEVYGRYLFHGPEFQVIRTIRGVSEDAMEGTLSGVAEMGWSAPPSAAASDREPARAGWQTDPAAFDGGLQLAVLWTRERAHAAALPTGFSAFRAYGEPGPGPGTCALRGRRSGPLGTVADLCFIDGQGRVWAEIQGLECHTLSSGVYPTPNTVALAK